MDETDETMKPSSKNTSESISGIFKDFTCRVCLYRHEDNLEISDHLNTFVEYISKHLCFQVGSEDKFPMWICKFCQQSLQSFHKFYIKVSQIQESFTNLISVLKESPRKLDESPTLDAEFDAIDLTIGFHRGKSQQSVKKLKEISPRRISTRISSKMAKSPIYSKNCTLDLSKKKNEKELQKIVEIDNGHPCEGNDDVLNYQSGIENNSVSNTQDSKDSKELIMLETAGNSEIPSKRGKSNKDDDLSSLEDQDWVGQGLTFDIGSDDSADDTWKPAGKSKRKIGSEDFCSDDTWKPAVKSRRKKSDEQSVEDTSNQLETCDDDKDISDEDVDAVNPKAKKSKLKITATHGTGPKPKLTPEVKRIMREEINAKFVEFYGISCDICVKDVRENSLPIEPAKYDSFVALCDHMKAEHNVRGYVKCCNCTMRDKKRAERHMLLHTQPGSIFKCNICGKQLSTQQSFRSHILLHLPDNERPFQCSQCDRGFATKPDLTLHERQHLPEDERLTCTCDICGSRFGYESGLLLHKQRVHGNNRPYLCDLCAKSFKSRCDMERHKAQTHGEVKREQCQECGKWFKGKSILKTHMRQHLGAHFPCEHCDKTYSVRSSWKAHQLTHSTEKTHICPVCNKAFKLPGTLKMHLNQHTGEHPYSCPFCPKTFASSGNYYTHRKRMHPEEVALLKKNHEAALAANGLPPPPPGPPVVAQSLSEAIEQTKQKVAAQGITIPIVDENITSLNADVLSNDIEDSDVVPPSATILTEKSVLTNAVIMSSGSVPDVNFLVANGLRIVRIISPEGTTKYSLGRKGEDTLNLAQSQLSLGPQLIQVDSGITQENNDPEESGMPFSVL